VSCANAKPYLGEEFLIDGLLLDQAEGPSSKAK